MRSEPIHGDETDGRVTRGGMSPEAWGRVRALGPVLWWAAGEAWLVTRYADCERVLRDPAFVLDPRAAGAAPAAEPVPEPLRPLDELRERWLLFHDPPRHTRLRAAVHDALGHRIEAGLRERIEAIARSLIEPGLASGKMDVVEAFAAPLPVRVIAGLLGVPETDAGRFRRWARDLVAASDLFPAPPLQQVLAARSAREIVDYVAEQVRRKRAAPADDVLGRMIAGREASGMDDATLVANAVLLMFAGFETTAAMIGNGLLALLRHPEQMARLRGRPERLGPAVAELLRFDGPVTLRARFAGEEVALGGRRIRRGERVLAVLAAANRDPERFRDPDRLDVTRREGASLAFGAGIHHCLGASLARLEGEVALRTLLEAGPRLDPQAGPPAWGPAVAIRSLASLPVRLEPAAS